MALPWAHEFITISLAHEKYEVLGIETIVRNELVTPKAELTTPVLHYTRIIVKCKCCEQISTLNIEEWLKIANIEPTHKD